MKAFILLLLLVFSFLSFAQNSSKENYYVTANSLNVRSGASIDSTQLFKLSQYDNIVILGLDVNSDWIKVKYRGKEGYVSSKFIKKGKVEITIYYVRTGAMCRDGTKSSATGRGACSHHGGVANWLKDEKKSVKIISD